MGLFGFSAVITDAAILITGNEPNTTKELLKSAVVTYQSTDEILP